MNDILTQKNYFEAAHKTRLKRMHLLVFEGRGVVLVQVPARQLAAARAAWDGRTAAGICVLFSALPWFSCWLKRHKCTIIRQRSEE